MIIVMKAKATKTEVDGVRKRLEDLGFGSHLSGVERTIIGAIGNRDELMAAK